MHTSWVGVPAAVLTSSARDVDVHTARWETTADARGRFGAVVCVHGLGGAHLNWRLLAPYLTRYGTVWAPDLAGFGLTAPAGRSSTLAANLDLLAGFVDTASREAGTGPVLLVGNSMGGLLSILLAARAPELVGALVLLDSALPAPLERGRLDARVAADFLSFLVPVLGARRLQARRRGTPEQQVRDTLELCGMDPDALPPQHLADAAALAAARRDLPWADRAFLVAARSVVAQLTSGRRRLWRAIDAIVAPVLLVHGDADRVVPVEAARAVAARQPSWTYREYDGVGHVPLLSDPLRVATDVAGWLEALPAPAPAPGSAPQHSR